MFQETAVVTSEAGSSHGNGAGLWPPARCCPPQGARWGRGQLIINARPLRRHRLLSHDLYLTSKALFRIARYCLTPQQL